MELGTEEANMTRETKVGLVVSGSFLCLVGIVFFSKMREPAPDTETLTASVIADQEPTPAAGGSSEQSPSSAKASEIPVAPGRAPGDPASKVQPALFKPGDGVSALPSSPSTGAGQSGSTASTSVAAPAQAKEKSKANEAVQEQTILTDDITHGQKSGARENTSAREDKKLGEKLSSASPEAKSSEKLAEQKKVDAPKSTIPPVPQSFLNSQDSVSSRQQQTTTRPTLGQTVQAGEKPAAQTQGTSGGNSAAILAPPTPPPAAPDLTFTKVPSLKGEAWSGPIDDSLNGAVGLGSRNPAGAIPGKPDSAVADSALGKAGQSSDSGVLAAPKFGSKGEDRKETAAPLGLPGDRVAPPSTTAVDNGPVLGAPNSGRDGSHAAESARPGSSTDDASAKMLRPVPRLGGTSTASSNQVAQSGGSVRSNEIANGSAVPQLGGPVPTLNRPLAMPMPKAAVQSSSTGNPLVESYDEDTYTCRGNETFRMISQTYYQSDRYERALLLFNRSHPLAAASIRQDPPQLRPGQKVYVPPDRILEKYYASAIAEAPAVDAVPATRNTDPTPAIRPMAVTPVATVTPTPAQPQEKTYRVGAAGEMMRDIARRTLGDADRWPEIYQLNLRYDPKEPVPAGAELRLPASARTDAAATP
jgi:hypothetical protein